MPRKIVVWVALLAGACGGVEPELEDVDVVLSLTPDPDAGGAVYAAQCAGCHGEDGSGGVGTSFVEAFALLHEAGGSWEIEVRAWVGTILEGAEGTAMAGWRDELTDQQVADVVDYLHASWGGG